MLSMYIILVHNSHDDEAELKSLKRLLYSLLYMDNGGVSANTQCELRWACSQLEKIFGSHQFKLQKFVTNDQALQSDLDTEEPTPTVVPMFGLLWDRSTDELSTQPIHLDVEAKTKRSILSTIASNYDIFQFNGPILNRSRIFMHELQCDKSLGWDDILSEARLKLWRNISRQANASAPVKLPRFVGRRDGQYNLVACSDSSKTM